VLIEVEIVDCEGNQRTKEFAVSVDEGLLDLRPLTGVQVKEGSNLLLRLADLQAVFVAAVMEVEIP
jgi:hypothetical protein